MAIVPFPLKLTARRMLAPTVGHYTFQRSDGQLLAFTPGQFIQIHFDQADGTPARRSYSLANPYIPGDEPTGVLEIAVSFVPGGAATALFESLQVGQEVQASGPYGRFCLQPGDHNGRYLLVATGTGVTPYRAMLPTLKSLMLERGIEVVLLQGARRQCELLYLDEFRAVAKAHQNFHYLPCLSRELPAKHEDVRQGYVQQCLAELHPDPAHDIAYLCGNPNMVDASFAALKTYGLGVPQIRREKYILSTPPSV